MKFKIIVRRKHGKGFTFAIVTGKIKEKGRGKNSWPEDEIVRRIRAAIAEWHQDFERIEVSKKRKLNISHLASRTDDPDIRMCLRREGIADLKIRTYADDATSLWDYDDYLGSD